MTREYAILSLRAGCIAGAIDDWAGGHVAMTLVRNQAWKLTEHYLREMKLYAESMGMPAELLVEAEATVRANLALHPNLLDAAMRLQSTVDRSN